MRISHKKYDVFISFMGEDTGTNFTAQLHRALTNKNIESCIDYNLGKGDEVEAALAKAIQDSRISIVVFSENYATSKWCLDELLHILKCRELHGQVVIPVFCNIDPSHVRRQTGSYEMAFARYERQLANSKSHLDKVSEWKAALSLAANISGWDARKYRDDSQAIEQIVEDVSQKLSHMYPTELEDLVKVDENSEHIELLLKTIQRIGIWGMSGIGKTTIAKQMFAKNFAHYDNVCFLEKVREESEKFGPLYVQKKLLSELVKREITASDVHGLPTFIKRRLGGKKSFIVLDDVDNATQLDYLCGVLGDLGPNSRLIITTRDRHALSGKVDEIYEVKTWKPKDSLKLFSIRAFNQDHPLKGYERVSERVVECAGGVPLALEVLGSYFHSKKPEFWESELNLYENKGEAFPDIQKVLRASFNALSWQQKEIFLDIAFFFKSENKDFVTRILNAFGFNATSEIKILEDKALITFSNNSRIQMHDLRQKMAFDIVREEYSDRGTRSRLRDAKDICDVLGKNKGSDAIEGIIFDLSQKLDVHVQADTFNLMTKLRFLKFHIPSGKKKLGTVHLPENIMPFFKKLTYLEWNGYPLKSLPQPFCAEQLIQICLPHSNIKYLWHGMQELVHLEAIDLSECKQLRNLPDLSGALKLKQLRLSGCDSLREVQPSAFSKDTLDTLLLDRCTKLQSLKGEKHLTSLVNFSVKGCKSLKEFSLSSDSIKRLDLSKTGIETLHPSIGDMNKLSWLNLEGLNLKNLPIALSRLRSLTELRVSKCSIVTKSNLEALFDGLRSLTLLHLKDCCNLCELPANISFLSPLYELRLDGSSVEELPASIKFLSELEVQSIDNCSKLRCLPELPLSIKEFQADNCTSLTTVSTLKTFSIKMIGKKKHISFKNSIKMELDGPSLDRITGDAILTMKSAAFHNVFLRKDKYTTYDFSYNSAEVCLPGRGVPIQFKHRSAAHSSLTIDISNSLGFIFSVVVSPSNRTQQREYYWFDMECQCYTEHGKSIAVYKSSWNNKLITDHVFILYDPYHSDAILTRFERNVSFEFFITTYTSSGREHGLLSIKECGVYPIYYSESQRVLGSWNLDKDTESELYEAIQSESRSVEEGMRKQEVDWNEKCQNPYACLVVSKDTQEYDDPQEKENWDDDDDSSKETEKSKILHESYTMSREESETSSHKQEQFEKEEAFSGGGSDVESSFNKAIKFKSMRNEGRATESEAALHLPLMSTVEENTFDNKSRLNNYYWQDIGDVLGNSKGSDAIEGIIFDLSQKLDTHVQADRFYLMSKLKFLKFHISSGKKKSGTLHFPENIISFIDKLTYLEWNTYPLKSLPQALRAEQLVKICFQLNYIENLWYGMQELVNLEEIDLSDCKELIKLPDLSGALKLKQLRLSGCESLCEVQPSAFSKESLDTLLLDGCTKLQRLKGKKHLASLVNFTVQGCKSLEEFSLSSDSIKRLDLSKTGIKILHPSIGDMKNLSWLNLEGLNLTNLPTELSRLRSLTELRVSKCSVVTKSKLEAIFDGLGSLTLLHLKYCCNLFELPANISSLSTLHELRLDGSSVEELPPSIKFLSELEVLSLGNCSKLRRLPELPSSLKEFQADNCTSLMTVSTLITFSTNMIGHKKYISFKNSIRLELDDPSLDRITEDVILTMKSAAFHNVLVRKERLQTHSYQYNSAVVCLPGCRVPREFNHRSATNSSITMNVSNSLGFIFAVVVSPSNRTQQHGHFVIMQCQCYTEDGKRQVGYKSRLNHKPIANLKMDHVFVWYDPYHSDSVLSSIERKISFKFCITTYSSSKRELGGLLSIKECGVCPIYYSESRRVLGTGNLDKKLELELYEEIQLKSRSGEGDDDGDDENEGTGIQNQQSDLNENCHSSYESSIVSNDTQVQENPQEKENLDDLDNSKEIMKFKIVHDSSAKSGEEIETSSNKQEQFEKEKDSTGGGSDVESSFIIATKFERKENEGWSTEFEAGLHLPVMSVVEGNTSDNKSIEYNYDGQDNFDETKQSEGKPNIQGGQVIVPDTTGPVSKEYSPMDLSNFEDGSDEDPFAELESILLGSPESSPEAACSTSDDVAVRESLHNLECLLENSLESILCDVELQQQLHTSLECIKQATLEKVSPNAVKLVQKMTSFIQNLSKNFVMTKKVVEDHINALQKREKLVQLMRHSMKQKKSMMKEKSQFEDESKRLVEEGEKVEEKIRILFEQKNSIELEKTKLKESMERCEGEKKKLEDEAKNMITESKELMSSIKKSKTSYDAALSKQQKMKDTWEGFRVDFADNYGSSSS